MRRSGNQDDNKHIINDLELLRKCIDFKNVVQCYGYYIMETEVWIFMELMTTCFDRLLKRLGAETRVPEQIIGKIVVSVSLKDPFIFFIKNLFFGVDCEHSRLPEGPPRRHPPRHQAVEHSHQPPGRHKALRLWHFRSAD